MELRPTAERFKYGKVIAGRVNYILRVPVAKGTYKEGQLIQTADGATFEPASAVAIANSYFVTAGDMVLDAAGELVVYAGGFFNKNIVKKGSADELVALTDADIEILKTKNIFIEEVSSQDYAYDEMENQD